MCARATPRHGSSVYQPTVPSTPAAPLTSPPMRPSRGRRRCGLSSGIAHILELNLDAVGRVEQDLRRAIPHAAPCGDAVLGESCHDPVGVEALHAEADVRLERVWPVP